MKQAYKELKFHAATLRLIDYMNNLIEGYIAQGFVLSVRQLYYQLVARGQIENTEKSYKRIADVINNGRLAGLIDWDAIEDRNRDVEMRQHWQDGEQIVYAAADSYHMDMWAAQQVRPFIIVEKAALAGVLGGICHEYDVPLLAARGYPSVSIVREMALEHFEEAIRNDQDVLVLHFGDHDPSGIDMTRDLIERFELFLGGASIQMDLQRIALNMDQINEQKPPPNPAKTTDSRFGDYADKFGVESWELDALEPSYLVFLVRQEFKKIIDVTEWQTKQEEIETIKKKLTRSAKLFKYVRERKV